MAATYVEYKCTYCGMTARRSVNDGRPDPGQCLRKPRDKNGFPKPHSWVKNRTW